MAGGVFAIENWAADMRSRQTVRPLLDYLEQSSSARVIHQRISTPRELHHYMVRWARQDGYGVGYLAMHGDRGNVWVGNQAVTLERLTAWADLSVSEGSFDPTLDDEPEYTVDLTGKVLYLASCSSLHVSPGRLDDLRATTGARLVCGFTRQVDWVTSGAFDILALSALSHATSSDGGRQGVSTAMRRLQRQAGSLIDALGFRSSPDHSNEGS